jgi:hypothetical protein
MTAHIAVSVLSVNVHLATKNESGFEKMGILNDDVGDENCREVVTNERFHYFGRHR